VRKEEREVTRIAEDLGVLNARVVPGDPHARLIGTVDGHQISIVVSLSKAFSCRRNMLCLKGNIRREIQKAKST
jgi:hypothetical protein